MKFAAGLSTKTDWKEAVSHLTGQIDAQLGAGGSDLGLLFAHPDYSENLKPVITHLRGDLKLKHVIGCTAAGVIGGDKEIENQPAISLLVARLPNVDIKPLYIQQEEVEEATGPGYWHFQLEVEPTEEPNFILFADPFSIGSSQLVAHLSEGYPGRPIVGGLASGCQRPGDTRLILDDQVVDSGAVAVALSGEIEVHPIVSQGCRPIGEPLVVTKAEKNLLFEIAGRPPIQILQEMLPTLPPRDQQLAKKALLLGRVINEYQEEYGRGDFLIRNLLGQDAQTGALAVGDLMRTGQTIQFQVRDATSADEDLRYLLKQERTNLGSTPIEGAVLFSCLGRGEGMYGTPHHDIGMLHQELQLFPTGGFFCNGEIGPIGAQTYVHGFTSVIGLFSRKE